MSTPLTFTWDSRELAVFRGRNIDRAMGRALRLAGNQAIRFLHRGEMDLATSRKALPRPLIAEDQKLSLPHRGADLRDFVWRIYIQGKPVPVSKFPHLDTRSTRSRNGVLVRFGDGGTRRLERAFTATMRSSHAGVFRRVRGTRLPIQELYSSRLPARFGGEVVTTYSDKTFRKLETAFQRGLDRELAKLRRKGDA
jgi:hypothetical protein